MVIPDNLMKSNKSISTPQDSRLFEELSKLIEDSRKRVAVTANSVLILLYWQIGKRINEEVLKNKRAEYGKQIVSTLSTQLKEQYGRSFEEKNLRRMMQFVEQFPDEKIAQQLKSADTIGCFYIESPAMRQLLTKLKCDNYLRLVVASSIIRPGVASSGMMKAYIERHHDPSKVQYLHPVFEKQLKETYGVMDYQEDVMKIGHYYGGLDLANADVLRRMMSGKYRHKDHLIEIE